MAKEEFDEYRCWMNNHMQSKGAMTCTRGNKRKVLVASTVVTSFSVDQRCLILVLIKFISSTVCALQ